MTTPDRLAERLEPCPFCGSEAEWNLGKKGDDTPWRYLACSECEAMGPCVRDSELSATDDAYNDSVLIEAWNRRALATPVPGTVSNAMVERAWRELVPGNLSVISITKDDLRAALEAAVQSPPAGGRVRGLDVFRAIYDPGILAGPKGDRSLTQWQTDAVCAALSSLAPVEVATEPVAVLDIAKIVDPHPFLPGPAHEEDWAEDMVRQSQELALSKARRILAFLSRGADPLYVHPTGDSGALREALEKALLWTEEEHDVGEWRTAARAALKGEPGK